MDDQVRILFEGLNEVGAGARRLFKGQCVAGRLVALSQKDLEYLLRIGAIERRLAADADRERKEKS